jgi:hypothetical protein
MGPLDSWGRSTETQGSKSMCSTLVKSPTISSIKIFERCLCTILRYDLLQVLTEILIDPLVLNHETRKEQGLYSWLHSTNWELNIVTIFIVVIAFEHKHNNGVCGHTVVGAEGETDSNEVLQTSSYLIFREDSLFYMLQQYHLKCSLNIDDAPLSSLYRDSSLLYPFLYFKQ